MYLRIYLCKVYLTMFSAALLHSVKMAGQLIMREWSCPNLGHCPSICLTVWKKPTKASARTTDVLSKFKPSTSKI